MSKVNIFLPVRNEEIDLAQTIQSIKKVTSDKIIVVDNASTDKSFQIAKAQNVEVWNEKNIGKANVIKKILKDCNSDIVFMMDADSTYDVSSYNSHKDLMIAKNLDMIVGKRKYDKEFLKRKDRKLANKLFNFLFMIFIGGNFTDICSGYRFLKKDSFNKLEIKSKNFEIETEISVYSVFNKLKTLEVDIDYKERINSQSKLKTFSDSLLIFWFFLKKSVNRKN